MATAPDPIPDVLAELRAGRFGYDFVRALTGEGTEAAGRRARVLTQILDGEDGAEAVTNLLLIGVRTVLNHIGAQAQQEQGGPTVAEVATRLVDATPQQFEDYAVSLEYLTRR